MKLYFNCVVASMHCCRGKSGVSSAVELASNHNSEEVRTSIYVSILEVRSVSKELMVGRRLTLSISRLGLMVVYTLNCTYSCPLVIHYALRSFSMYFCLKDAEHHTYHIEFGCGDHFLKKNLTKLDHVWSL